MSEPVAPIRGKVARVLNARDLALNVGKSHGVQPGMLFDVLDSRGEKITDPDSEEVLGSVPQAKVRVKVSSVLDRLSVASTYRSKEANLGGAGVFDLSSALMPARWVRRYETLRKSDTSYQELDESESYVHRGDPVVQVWESADAKE